MSLFICLSVAILLVLSNSVSSTAETAIPLNRNGNAFHRGNMGAITTVELFIDLTCSACRDSWPLLTQVYQTYKDRVHFLYRIFPLPYHQQGFIVAKGAQAVNAFSGADAAFKYIDISYAKQPAIYNSATADMTYNEVVDLVSEWAIASGISKEQYYTAMNSSTTIGSQCEMNTRYMWKYVTLQGVYATPFVAIDGLKTMGLDTFADWAAALDPLVS
jgi:hypothetical protein